MKKYLVERNGNKFIESTSGFRPVDAIVEFTGQIPEDDIDYVIGTDSVDIFGNPVKVLSVDASAKAIGDAAKLAALDSSNWDILRKQRDDKLKACDHTQLADAPISVQLKADFVVYRAALRDLPANTIDPTNPVWPVEPV